MSGTINVKNASASASGTYVCTATNRVGSEQCILHLNVTPREYQTDISQFSTVWYLLISLNSSFPISTSKICVQLHLNGTLIITLNAIFSPYIFYCPLYQHGWTTSNQVFKQCSSHASLYILYSCSYQDLLSVSLCSLKVVQKYI